jgi:hypothetical protein
VRLEAAGSLRSVVAFPLIAGVMVGACRSGAEPANNSAVVTVAPTPAAATPTEVAQRLVTQRLGSSQGLAFSEAQVFNSAGAAIVCGRVARPGSAPERYIAVGEEDVFVESQMEAGHMDQAFAEFCRNA